MRFINFSVKKDEDEGITITPYASEELKNRPEVIDEAMEKFWPYIEIEIERLKDE